MRSTFESEFPGTAAKRLSVYLSVRDQVHHRSIAVELLKRVKKRHLMGASVFEAAKGFGTTGTVHETHLFGKDAPITVVIVDTPERIDSFVADVSGDLLAHALFVIEEIELLDM